MIDGPRSARVAAGGQPHARGARALLADDLVDSGGSRRRWRTLGKPQRQHRIARLLEEQAVSSQAQLVELLAADGVIATQATVSRDLEELGAVKVRIPGGAMAYAIPEHAKDRTVPDDHLRRVMGEFVVEVAHSGEPRRAAHAAGLAHVVALGARPGRARRGARYGRRRRHDPRGVRRGSGRRVASPSDLAGLAGSDLEAERKEWTQ